MTTTNLENVLACLSRVAEREEARAKAEFLAANGRVYDGSSDADWDALDKDYTGVEAMMDVARAVHATKASLDVLPV